MSRAVDSSLLSLVALRGLAESGVPLGSGDSAVVGWERQTPPPDGQAQEEEPSFENEDRSFSEAVAVTGLAGDSSASTRESTATNRDKTSVLAVSEEKRLRVLLAALASAAASEEEVSLVGVSSSLEETPSGTGLRGGTGVFARLSEEICSTKPKLAQQLRQERCWSECLAERVETLEDEVRRLRGMLRSEAEEPAPREARGVFRLEEAVASIRQKVRRAPSRKDEDKNEPGTRHCKTLRESEKGAQPKLFGVLLQVYNCVRRSRPLDLPFALPLSALFDGRLWMRRPLELRVQLQGAAAPDSKSAARSSLSFCVFSIVAVDEAGAAANGNFPGSGVILGETCVRQIEKVSRVLTRFRGGGPSPSAAESFPCSPFAYRLYLKSATQLRLKEEASQETPHLSKCLYVEMDSAALRRWGVVTPEACDRLVTAVLRRDARSSTNPSVSPESCEQALSWFGAAAGSCHDLRYATMFECLRRHSDDPVRRSRRAQALLLRRV